MQRISKKQSFTKLAVLIAIIVMLTFIIGLVSTSKAYALGEENPNGYFTGKETVANLNNVVKNNSPSESAPVSGEYCQENGHKKYR